MNNLKVEDQDYRRSDEFKRFTECVASKIKFTTSMSTREIRIAVEADPSQAQYIRWLQDALDELVVYKKIMFNDGPARRYLRVKRRERHLVRAAAMMDSRKPVQITKRTTNNYLFGRY